MPGLRVTNHLMTKEQSSYQLVGEYSTPVTREVGPASLIHLSFNEDQERIKLGKIAHTCNHNSGEAETGQILGFTGQLGCSCIGEF